MADDLYAVLGVPKNADHDSIKKAYRKLAKELHPDKNPGNAKAESRFKSVNHAFDVLGNDKKRVLYDEFGEDALREGFDADKARAYKHWASANQGGRRGGGARGGVHEVNLEDLFNGGPGGVGSSTGSDFFGDLFGRGGRRARGPVKGADLESEMSIDFVSAVRGATFELRLNGAIEPVSVRIPPGAAEGSRIRIPGHGAQSMGGGPPGDMIVVLHVQPHKWFKRDGDDLRLALPITLAEAYVGAKVKVPTADGAVTIKVPPRTQSGAVLRVRGKGVARKGKDAGDLYVELAVQVPTEDSPEVAALVEKLGKFQTEDPRKDIAF
jgi:curved DNA-binding protein